MQSFKTIEQIIANKILPQLKFGRGKFDHDHTLAVVDWIKWLIQKNNSSELDSAVLITSAYAHDWGYVGLFKENEGENLQKITQKKAQHMERGARKINYFLKTKLSNYFTREQIQRVIHLVAVHDKIEKLNAEDEIILMEADTLGMIDSDKVKPTFSYEDNKKFLEEQLYGRRFLYFKHKYATEMALKLARKRERFYLPD